MEERSGELVEIKSGSRFILMGLLPVSLSSYFHLLKLILLIKSLFRHNSMVCYI